jgi:hypothetical protein
MYYIMREIGAAWLRETGSAQYPLAGSIVVEEAQRIVPGLSGVLMNSSPLPLRGLD